MAKTSLILTTTDILGRKQQKSITDVNPNADTAALKTFAQMCNNLTTNTYVSTDRIDKINCDTEAGTSKTAPTLAIDGGNTIQSAGVDTTKAITYNGDGVLYISPSNHSNIIMGVQNVNNSYQFIAEKPATLTGGAVTGTIYASETTTYKSASVDFTFTY